MSEEEDLNEDKKEVVKKKSREVISYYLREPYMPFIICIFSSILLQTVFPISILPGFISIYGAIALLAIGLFTLRWATKHMFLNGEKWSPLHFESRVLIVFGPYHYSRNPMFVAAVTFYIALFVFLNNMWGLILLFPLIKLLGKFVIAPREEEFSEEYDETYDDYHAKTPRWL